MIYSQKRKKEEKRGKKKNEEKEKIQKDMEKKRRKIGKRKKEEKPKQPFYGNNLGQVEWEVQVVVDEMGILFRVQNLEQGCSWVSVDSG